MEKKKLQQTLPLIPVRNVVILPNAQVPISLKRDKSVRSLEAALTKNKTVLMVMQKSQHVDEPNTTDLFDFGTISRVVAVQRLPDGIINITVEGVSKAKIIEHTKIDPYFEAQIQEIPEPTFSREEVETIVRPIVEKFRQIISMGRSVPLDLIPTIFDLSRPMQIVDMIIFNLDLKSIEKQALLEAPDLKARLKILTEYLSKEGSVNKTARKIQDRTAEEIGKNAKEAFLREQLRTIEKELGVKEEKEEFSELEKKIRAVGMPKGIQEKSLKELDRLRKMTQFSPETSYIRTYLDWLVEVPWKNKSESKINLTEAEKILHKDHYGLKNIKKSILENLEL